MHRRVFGLDDVEDASEKTLRLGSWSSAYINRVFRQFGSVLI